MKFFVFRLVLPLLGVCLFLLLISFETSAQCNTLRPQVTIDFNTDQDCAPVTVTQYSITYYFNAPQNPNNIQIRYEWKDPANTITNVAMGSGLVASAGNTAFTAMASFTYVNNNSCTITPTSYIIISGIVCQTSRQEQSAFFWGTEQQGNAHMSMNPLNFDVCFDNPIVNAGFRDNSDFNCRIGVEPDNPNRLARHVQFVYGTNHNAASTIRDLTLTNAGPQPLTDGSGALANPQTRGTGSVTVTAGYFGPIQPVPFPADGPNAITFRMNAPANSLNLVGNRFEITLFNWNACNPWNGDAVNPNYEDAVLTHSYIRIVQAPSPNFETRDNLGVATSDFCINEQIFFANLTPNINVFNYTWTFFDDATGTTSIGTSTSKNPTFQYPTGGQKLIRLRATNPGAQGSCIEEITKLVNITPALIAKIQVSDLSDVPITPYFCQNSSAPFTSFSVRFKDISSGTPISQTKWKWEFYNENNVLFRQEPAGGGYSNTKLGPFDLSYLNRGVYRVRLSVIDDVTLCETSDEVRVRVYENPIASFSATSVCEGQATAFTESSTINSINGETIVLREWDFNYDGVTFNKDPSFDNQTIFSRSLGTGGIYQVALRVTTNQNTCSSIIVVPVKVNSLPMASFTPDVSSGCSELTINFTNNSINGQPDVIDRFAWEVNEGAGFAVVATQHPTDPGFSPVFTYTFKNLTPSNKPFDIRLRVVTVSSCERISSPATITVLPGTDAGFNTLNYSPFNSNCSPVSVSFSADAATQSLLPTDYTWKVTDLSGVISQASTGTTPTYTYNFVNSTSLMKDFQVTLTATLASGCFGDSVRTIRISPVPVSTFDIDTLQFDCERMRLRFVATQKGLEYHWIVSENATIMSDVTSGDDWIEYEVLRSTVDNNLAVSLETRNLANCVSPRTTQSVIVPKRDVINASFTVSPVTQTLPNSTVTITNTTNVGAWTYEWTFGDGSSSTSPGPTLQHVYATFGTYTITLNVKNSICLETQTKSITILPVPPIADFDFLPNAGCVPLTVKFTNRSKYADPDKYIWEFGDGEENSKAISPTHVYYVPGKFTVSLTAINSDGVATKVTKPLIIEVYPQPKALFDVKPKVVTMPGGTLYTSNRSFEASSFLWDFGDDTKSTEAQPQHSYTREGEFSISLIAFNDLGCSDTARMVNAVKVIKGGQVLIPNAFSPNPTGSTGSNPDSGKNDVFLPLMRGVVEFEMLIFNRWGELLFETRDQQFGWDGYFNGKLCAQDVYVYKLTASFDTGEKIVRVGDINLIR
jgi:gliding motility-associated-like protein